MYIDRCMYIHLCICMCIYTYTVYLVYGLSIYYGTLDLEVHLAELRNSLSRNIKQDWKVSIFLETYLKYLYISIDDIPIYSELPALYTCLIYAAIMAYQGHQITIFSYSQYVKSEYSGQAETRV